MGKGRELHGGCWDGNQMCVLEVGDWDPHPSVNKLYAPKPDTPHDMTQPLSHYFISSGHNSYLSGNQLWSRSTTKVIISSLLEGCRVIELDCYNQKAPFNGPIVKHGGTLTAPISFRRCVEAISANAFKASPYPVIITLENHTDEANQKQMAKDIRQVLGDKLYVPNDEDRKRNWKSPEELKHKVLIRANASSACEELKSVVYLINVKFKSLDAANASEGATTSSFNEHKIDALTTKAFKHSELPLEGVTVPIEAESGDPGEASPETVLKTDPSVPIMKRAPTMVARDEANTFTMTSKGGKQVVLHSADVHHGPGPHEGGVKKAEESKKKMNENEDENVDDDVGQQVVQSVGTLQEVYQYTSRHLMRVYPGGLRVTSTNYDPSNAWTLGASLAALNWQNWGTSMFLNRAKFSVNNKTGYVLKPSWMINPVGKNPLPPRKPRKLCVTIYCAYALQKGILCWKDDMYVALELRGMPVDCQEVESAAIWNSGRLLLNQKFYFSVSYPEMAQLALMLMDDDLPGKQMDDVLGTFACPISTLNPGNWKVYLTSPKGKLKHSRWLKVGFQWLDDDHAASTPCPPVTEPNVTEATTKDPEFKAGINGDDVNVSVGAH